jgi:acyl-CoA thioester hydrolase/thioesterase-3
MKATAHETVGPGAPAGPAGSRHEPGTGGERRTARPLSRPRTAEQVRPDQGTSDAPPSGRTRFETAMQVRPDDLDLNAHVHASRYFDYLLAARYDQMGRCYGMSMEAFLAQGLGWFTRTSHIEYKRPLKLGEHFVVQTWIEEFHRDGVRVGFRIRKRENGKLAADGWCDFTLVDVRTGRAVAIPDAVRAKYAI